MWTCVHNGACGCAQTLQSCAFRLFAIPGTVAHQAPLSMGFSRQEYWSGLPFPSPGDLPNPGIEPRSSLEGGFPGHWCYLGSPYAIVRGQKRKKLKKKRDLTQIYKGSGWQHEEFGLYAANSNFYNGGFRLWSCRTDFWDSISLL